MLKLLKRLLFALVLHLQDYRRKRVSKTRRELEKRKDG